ncbi:MAG TPA: tRNA uridine-5-carboxymethylaminomethyl(34) synthesis GTPase MnmE [Beijerinckiaceae bacterium]|jgi:tRNA modification GTPase
MVPGEVDTIFAAASGFGKAAVCVVRVSGPGSADLVTALAGVLPAPRRLSLRRLRDPITGEVLDEALVVWMPSPHTFTGEDQAELHLHGGLAVRAGVLRCLTERPGCRPAEPGEFTRRAFLNGRLDLTRVEGLADLIDAETEAQRRQALRQLEGELGRQAETWRERLLDVLARLEAGLDFADEADVPEEVDAGAIAEAAALADEIAVVLSDGTRGERLREGFTVVLAGPPNAGKSTLLNALARREVAIVSDVPGTTRDAIEVRCDLDGLPVTLVDTAGLRDSLDPVERIGIERTYQHLRRADLVLWLHSAEERNEPAAAEPGKLLILTKSDLHPGQPKSTIDIAVSAKTGEGLPALLARVRAEAEMGLGHGDALVTRERHRIALSRARDALHRACMPGLAPELVAEEVRTGARALAAVTGRVDVDDVLDRLFSSFCIGK